MKILVIGGTQFIGKHFVTSALERGHELTLFNRGTKPVPAMGVEAIVGDRNTDLGKLAGRSWDAVVDTSGYLPEQVTASARLLEPNVGRYLFISTISVYANPFEAFLNEDSDLAQLEDESVEQVTDATYGGLKAVCERELRAVYPPERTLIVRPTLVVGPEDHTDRFTYWPVRVSRGGRVLAPHGPDLPLQWIDVRDLAAFLVNGLEDGLSGIYNAASEPDRFNMGALLSACAQAASVETEFVWVEDEFLLEQQVAPFADLPLWLPGTASNMLRVDTSRAQAAGLTVRAAEETVKDTLVWHRLRGSPDLKVGLTAEREGRVLGARAAQ